MLRPSSLLLLALLAGCADRGAPRDAALLAPPPGGPGVATAPNAPVRAAAPAAAPHARRPGTPIGESPLGDGPIRDSAQLAAACRSLADRIVAQRDRSEIMREDERDSRQGTFDSPFQFRAPIDQMGRQVERDRIARDCVARNGRGTPER